MKLNATSVYKIIILKKGNCDFNLHRCNQTKCQCPLFNFCEERHKNFKGESLIKTRNILYKEALKRHQYAN